MVVVRFVPEGPVSGKSKHSRDRRYRVDFDNLTLSKNYQLRVTAMEKPFRL